MNNLAQYKPPTSNVGSDPRRDFQALSGNWDPTVDTWKPNYTSVMNVLGIDANRRALTLFRGRETVLRQESAVHSFEEKVFDTLVSLKVSISTFAMHLTVEERQRLFDELDDTVNVDDWHEGDRLPTTESFQQFLKWMIFSRNVGWTSIGVSDSGTILVAWRKPKVLLTADFDGVNTVRWTARLVGEEGEIGHTAGRCPLKLFAEQAKFYLER